MSKSSIATRKLEQSVDLARAKGIGVEVEKTGIMALSASRSA